MKLSTIFITVSLISAVSNSLAADFISTEAFHAVKPSFQKSEVIQESDDTTSSGVKLDFIYNHDGKESNVVALLPDNVNNKAHEITRCKNKSKSFIQGIVYLF